jgi:hypothetical protein
VFSLLAEREEGNTRRGVGGTPTGGGADEEDGLLSLNRDI